MEQKIMNQSEGMTAWLNQEPIQLLLRTCGVSEERAEAFKATLLAWKQEVMDGPNRFTLPNLHL